MELGLLVLVLALPFYLAIGLAITYNYYKEDFTVVNGMKAIVFSPFWFLFFLKQRGERRLEEGDVGLNKIAIDKILLDNEVFKKLVREKKKKQRGERK